MKLPANLNKLFSYPQGEDERVYRRAVFERLYKAEENIGIARLFVLIANTALYLLTNNTSVAPEIAYTAMAGAWAYGLLMLAAKPYKIYGLVLSAFFTCIAEAAFLTLWLWIAGRDAPAYFLTAYFSIAAIAYLYNAGVVLLSVVVFSACYLSMLLAHGQLFREIPVTAMKCVYLAITGIAASLIANSAGGQTREQILLRDAEEKLWEIENQVREKEDAINGLNTVLEDRVRARTTEIQATADKYKELTDTMPFIAWTMDVNGQVTYSNKKYQEHFEGSEEKDVTSAAYGPDAEKYTAAWEHAKNTGSSLSMECRWAATDGPPVCMMVSIVPVRDDKGSITTWMGTATDVTGQKKVSEQKDRFIGIASFEMKAPVNSIRSYVQLVKGALDNNEHEAAKIFINKTTGHIDAMEQTISDMLDVIRMRGNRMVYDRTEFDFSELLEECVTKNKHGGKHHRLFLLKNEHIKIAADRQRLKQTVDILLGSSIAYASGHSDIFIRSAKDSGKLMMSITSKGMSTVIDKLGSVLDRNTAAEDEEMPQGLGLGFYIAREVILQHNGNIWAEKAEGNDAAFYVTLPVMN